MSIRVYDPTAEDSPPAQAPVERLTTLRGCTVGLLDNSKIRVRELLDAMAEILRRDYGVADVLRLRKSDPSRPAPPEVMAALERCDALISAVGD